MTLFLLFFFPLSFSLLPPPFLTASEYSIVWMCYNLFSQILIVRIHIISTFSGYKNNGYSHNTSSPTSFRSEVVDIHIASMPSTKTVAVYNSH